MYRWGSEVIQAHLKHDHNYVVSEFKIEKFLDDSGLRKKYSCTTIKKQKAEKKKKHTIVDVDVDVDGIIDRVTLFDDRMKDYFWSYDNKGLKVLQLRFYPISTNVK